MFNDDDFCDGAPIERKVILANGEEHPMWFKQLPNTEWKRFYMWLASEDEDVRLSAEANLISRGLCDAQGEPVLTPEKAMQLKLPVLGRIMLALREVNGLERPAGNG